MIEFLKKRIKNVKMRQKMTSAFVAISVVPLLVMGFFAYFQTRSMLLSQEKSNIHDFAVQSALSMDGQIKIYNNLSDYIAYNQSVSNVISYEYKSEYEQYEQLVNVFDPMILGLKYFNDDINKLTIYAGRDIVKHDTTLAPVSEVEETDWYKRLPESTGIRWFVDKRVGSAVSVRTMPLLENLPKKSVLYISVNYDKLFEPFCHMSGEEYGVFVVDAEGNELFSYENIENEKDVLTLSDIGVGSEAGTKSIDSKYTVVREKSEFGWDIIVYRPNRVIRSSISSIILLVVAVTAVCIIVSVILSFVMVEVMVEDIQNLAKNMEEVEKGNMAITITSDAKDEIGELIRGFGNMITRINHLINEVYAGEVARKEAEMKALQAQINPHFLYNSLSLINWKAIDADQEDISRITLLLSRFYRTALNKGKNVISVREEISNVQSYIDLQRMMHDDSFKVEYDFSEEIMEYAMPNLILQPLIENAIDHGIDLKEGGEGVLTLKGYQEGEEFVLSVSDNGIGMTAEQAESILTENSKGYGVKNVQDRIRHFYGNEHGLKVESVVGKGTTITMRFPIKRM
ncbi:MAG: sensor histidine kinase [Lachnospiraceae bacterium]|nr:sensor histidine kinase [Lachnospiraceae bacterium]